MAWDIGHVVRRIFTNQLSSHEHGRKKISFGKFNSLGSFLEKSFQKITKHIFQFPAFIVTDFIVSHIPFGL